MALDELYEPEGVPDDAEDASAGDAIALSQPEEQPIGVSVKPPMRRRSLVKDTEELVYRIIKRFEDDIQDRAEWEEGRIQRMAKYRGWKDKKSFPWEDASNVHLPIIATDVQRTEDTLHNAVLAVRPVMNAKATNPAYADKEIVVDQLLDHQIFTENKGEERIGNLISSFTQDGQFVAYIPYIKETQKVSTVHMLDYPPAKQSWDAWIFQHLSTYYPKATILPGKDAPWNWIVKDVHPLTGNVTQRKIEVFQADERDDAKIQMVCHAEETIFDGPSLIPVELEDIVVPARCENMQPRSMSNPTGAPHVFMVEYPTRDEILRLIDSGFYDEVSNEDKEKIKAAGGIAVGETRDPEGIKVLRDDLAGVVHLSRDDKEEGSLTRLMFFGKEDLDGDGFEEEVVYWILKETRILLRARYLSEVYPTVPMRRPFAMAKYIPVNGEFYAIGLIELMESGYDIIKKTFDQMVDSGDLTNTPWGFYRPMSGIRPETLRMGPGDHYPTNDPKNDVFYPQLPQGMSAYGHNLIALVSQILDQATLVGQLQLGGVPHGKSAALRTTSNMQALLQQGDARPERVMRRFFAGLTEIWQQFHELNQLFLPKAKQFRISSGVTDATNPYVSVPDRSAIAGRFMFEFGASILNTNKALATGTLQELIGMLVNPLLLQLGIVTPDHIYQLTKDLIKAKGQDPKKYIQSPTNDPMAAGPMINVDDALGAILQGYYPVGKTIEPLPEHLQKLQEFVSKKENLDVLTPAQIQMLGQYVAVRVQEFQQMMAQQQMLQNAALAQKQAQSGGGEGAPAGIPPDVGPGGNAKVEGGELLDESLPGAQGKMP